MGLRGLTHLFLDVHAWAHSLDTIAALDDIGLERNGAWSAVQLEKQAAGIAEDLTSLIASPERGSRGLAVHTCGLLSLLVAVSCCHGRHDESGGRGVTASGQHSNESRDRGRRRLWVRMDCG